VDSNFGCIERKQHAGPLRVLTVGAIGLRKGSPYVLEVAKALGGQAKFRMVGSHPIGPQSRQALEAVLELTGVVPRSEIQQHFAWADVFLLPSLCEGSATVVYEALAAGLPVVCTPNAGSVVRDGIEGYITPVRDTEAMKKALLSFVGQPAMLMQMSANSRARANIFNTKKYREQLVEIIKK
jgi:glycosyltransferase involved in cell wall biosynthesis